MTSSCHENSSWELAKRYETPWPQSSQYCVAVVWCTFIYLHCGVPWSFHGAEPLDHVLTRVIFVHYPKESPNEIHPKSGPSNWVEFRNRSEDNNKTCTCIALAPWNMEISVGWDHPTHWRVPTGHSLLIHIHVTLVTHTCVNTRRRYGFRQQLAVCSLQSITWAIGELVSIGPLGTTLSEILIKCHNLHSQSFNWMCCL